MVKLKLLFQFNVFYISSRREVLEILEDNSFFSAFQNDTMDDIICFRQRNL